MFVTSYSRHRPCRLLPLCVYTAPKQNNHNWNRVCWCNHPKGLPKRMSGDQPKQDIRISLMPPYWGIDCDWCLDWAHFSGVFAVGGVWSIINLKIWTNLFEGYYIDLRPLTRPNFLICCNDMVVYIGSISSKVWFTLGLDNFEDFMECLRLGFMSPFM